MGPRAHHAATLIFFSLLPTSAFNTHRTEHFGHTWDFPPVGLGVGNMAHDEIDSAISQAVAKGTRLIDTASASRNEHLIARALDVPGGTEVQVLTKVWYTHLGYERTLLSVNDSIQARRCILRPYSASIAYFCFTCDPGTGALLGGPGADPLAELPG
jgi:hypothetical protein